MGEFPDLERNFVVCASAGATSATGGVATLVSRKVARGCRFSHTEVVPGRVLRVSVVRDRSTMVLWNIHNFCLGDIEQNVIRPLFSAGSVAAAHEPLDFIVFAGGDF